MAWGHSQSIMAGKPRRQDHEAAGHISKVRKQTEIVFAIVVAADVLKAGSEAYEMGPLTFRVEPSYFRI